MYEISVTQSLRFLAPSILILTLSLVGRVSCFGQTTRFQMDAAAPMNVESSSLLPDSPSAGMQQPGPPQPAPTQQPAPAEGTPLETKGPVQETEAERKARERAEAEAQVQKEEHQRNFGVIPNFNTVLGGRVPPLDAREKFALVYHTSRDPYTFTLAFIAAGLGEAEDSHTGYHWGAEGYFKRVGASYLDNVSGAFFGNAIFPILLHQDPRYFRKGTGSIKSRIVYSALSTVICRGDNGKRQFNISNVAGNFVAGGLSNAYYPSDERGFGLTIDNALVVTAEGAIGAQLLEFAPDITDLIHRRREHHRMMLQQQQQAAQGGAATPAPAPVAAPH